MPHNTQIKCPKCGTDIDVQDILVHQVEDQIKSKYQAQFEQEKKNYEYQLQSLNKAKTDFEKEKIQQKELFQERLEKELKEEKKAIEEKLKQKLLEEQSEQLQQLQKELSEKSEQVKELNRIKIQNS